MAQKQGKSKKPRNRPGAAAARVRADKRKAARVAKQKEQEKVNKGLAISDRPWQIAKAARKLRRENAPMQPRTMVGNIVKKLPDGTTRIIPGTKKETAEYMEARAIKREEELRAEQKKKASEAKRKANAEKAKKPHKVAS